jgi:hypothetical protein
LAFSCTTDGIEPIDLATFGVLSMARCSAPEIKICTIVRAAMLVDRGEGLVTGGGVTPCIDTTLYLLAAMLGQQLRMRRRASLNTQEHGGPIAKNLLRS